MKEVQRHFEVFPVSTRDQLARLYYSHTTNPEKRTTETCRKLVDRGLIEVNREFTPYVYYSKPLRVKKRSGALEHHLGIVDLYEKIKKHVTPRYVIIEYSFGKSYARPDMIIHLDRWYFVEYQPSIIPKNKMKKKIRLYEETFINRKHERFCKQFTIWIVTPKPYDVQSHLPIMQTDFDLRLFK